LFGNLTSALNGYEVLIRREATAMKTADFRGEITPSGQIAVPPEIASQVPPGEKVAVVLAWRVSAEENAWREAGRRRFESAYAPEDSVYEQLIHDPSA
jgi:hypothetical protein